MDILDVYIQDLFDSASNALDVPWYAEDIILGDLVTSVED